MNESAYDFTANGYAGPGDWARLNDLLLDDLPDRDRLEAGDLDKATVLGILRRRGIEVAEAYDAEAAGIRNRGAS